MKIDPSQFYKKSNLLRLNTIKMIFNGPTRTGHIASSLSIAEILNYLFSYEIFSKKIKKNYIVLSKGHAAPILYAAYEEKGYIKKKNSAVIILHLLITEKLISLIFLVQFFKIL